MVKIFRDVSSCKYRTNRCGKEKTKLYKFKSIGTASTNQNKKNSINLIVVHIISIKFLSIFKIIRSRYVIKNHFFKYIVNFYNIYSCALYGLTNILFVLKFKYLNQDLWDK